MKRWNRADLLLLLVAVAFCGLLLLKLRFADVLVIEALFFASEAALVGGAADWFAVTALFTKPLGFPYHTALLPRKRAKFTDACVKMIQTEFFSKKKLLLRIKKLDLLAIFLTWLAKNRGVEMMAGFVLQGLENIIARIDRQQTAILLERKILNAFCNVDQADFYRAVGNWCLENHKDEEILDLALTALQQKLERPETKQEILEFLQAYMEEKNQSLLTVFFALAAQISNIINFAEAAEILQNQLLKFTQNLQQVDSPLRQQVLAQVRASGANLSADANWQALVVKWQQDISAQPLLRAQLEQCLTSVLSTLKREVTEANSTLPTLATPLAKIVLQEIERGLMLIQADTGIRQAAEQFLYDLVSRSVLQAQAMIGVIVREILQELSDAEMNRLVYLKVEQDLLWIRMNGSIVGAVIGLGIFFLLNCI